MKWHGASQRKGTFSCLEQDGKEVRAVTAYTHTFILFEDGRADEQKQPFYTAVADTPQKAEALALAVYQQAQDCLHQMVGKGPMLIECMHCGLQRRVSMPSLPAPVTAPVRKPERKLFGFLRF